MRTANEYMDGSVSLVYENSVNNGFVDQYMALRHAEKRIYSDEALKQLPFVDENNLYAEEWKMRRQSSGRLIDYLKRKNRPLEILEVGCGNGWLSSQLAKKIDNVHVTGIDINLPELEQGASVFKDQHNLRFVMGDIRSSIFEQNKFDVVVFAASIQYFKDFSQIINTALNHVKAGGEIHILDSQFYSEDEVSEARKRSVLYFRKMGFENMSDLYFHHSLDALSNFKYDILYDSRSILNRVLKNRNPFRWIRIKSKK